MSPIKRKNEKEGRRRSIVEDPPKIIITGTPKIGKTTLACMFPDALIFDAEKGAGSQNVAIYNPPDGQSPMGALDALLDLMVKGKMKGKFLEFLPPGEETPLKVGALVIDSLDALQTATIQRRKAQGKMYQNDWGIILDRFVNMMEGENAIFQKLKIPVIIIAHVKTEPPVFTQDKDGNTIMVRNAIRDWGLAGSLVDKLDRYFDYIIQIVSGGEIGAKDKEKRIALIAPFVANSTNFKAGDRTGVLRELAAEGQKYIELDEDPDNPGFPKKDIMGHIAKKHTW